MAINKPKYRFRVFGSKAQDARYLPVQFGTNILVDKVRWDKIANKNFEYGLESLEGDVQLRDFNSALYYLSSALGYIFQNGIAEWTPYQEYPAGAVVTYEGKVYVAKEHIFGKDLPESIERDACGNPIVDCSVLPVDDDPCAINKHPNIYNKWHYLVDSTTYNEKIESIESSINNIKETIDSFGTRVALKNYDGSRVLGYIFINNEE